MGGRIWGIISFGIADAPFIRERCQYWATKREICRIYCKLGISFASLERLLSRVGDVAPSANSLGRVSYSAIIVARFARRSGLDYKIAWWSANENLLALVRGVLSLYFLYLRRRRLFRLKISYIVFFFSVGGKAFCCSVIRFYVYAVLWLGYERKIVDYRII